MPDTYKVFCLATDRAIHTSSHVSSEQAEKTAAKSSHDQLIGCHTNQLIAVGCPGRDLQHAAASLRIGCWHAEAKWAEVSWLRLLAAVRETPDFPVEKIGPFSCWPSGRLYRLRFELGTERLYETEPPVPHCPECQPNGQKETADAGGYGADCG